MILFGVAGIVVFIAKIIPSTYKPKKRGGRPTVFAIFSKILANDENGKCSHNSKSIGRFKIEILSITFLTIKNISGLKMSLIACRR